MPARVLCSSEFGARGECSRDLRSHIVRNWRVILSLQVYDAVRPSLDFLLKANGGKLPRRGPLSSEKEGGGAPASELSQRATTGSGAVQQPESIDRLISLIAGDDDDTPALEYMFRQHACAWVRAARRP